MEPRPWCDVRLLRAKDLSDRDVIRFRSRWRQILDIFRKPEDFQAMYGGSMDTIKVPYSDAGANDVERTPAWISCTAFEDPTEDDIYVVVRIWIHEEGAPGEFVDKYIRYYRNDLIEVQSLPGWEPAT